MKKFIHLLNFCVAFLFYIFLFPIAIVFFKNQKLWLFCERGIDAKDNSFYFYRWLNLSHPEINSYFLIEKHSVDVKKVRSVGQVVYFHSLKHWLVYIASSVRLSTHLYSCAPNKFLGAFFMKYHKKKGLDVFLQHGITHNYQDCFFRKNNKADINICAVKSEYDYLLKNFDLGVDHLKLTGFPRYDSLIDLSKERIVLVQPTWRAWIANLSEQEFANTEYYRRWQSLISDPDIIQLLKDNGTHLIFNIHPSLIKYQRLFKHSDDCVDIVYQCDDIQHLLNTSSLLITDYSSILFDFAYLKKPTIYYQFDESEFYTKQYKHGFFDISKHGFGKVVKDKNNLLVVLHNYLNNNFKIENLYLARIDSFFTFTDSYNSLRVYNEIMNKLDYE